MLTIDSVSERMGLSPSVGYMIFNSFLFIVWMIFELGRRNLSEHPLPVDHTLAYIAIYLLCIVWYVLLTNVVCRQELRATFSSLVLKGGLVSIAMGMVVNSILSMSWSLVGLYPMLGSGPAILVEIAWLLWAVSEEVAKLCTLLLAVKVGGLFPKVLPPGTVSVNTPRQFCSLAFAVGLGFEVWENAHYFHKWIVGGMPLDSVLYGGVIRSMTKVHGLWVASSAMALWSSTLRHGESVTLKLFVRAIVASSLLHYTWNRTASNIITVVINCVINIVVMYSRLRQADSE